MKPDQKRAVVQFFRVGYQISERRACRVAGVARSRCRYRSQAQDQALLRRRLRELAAVRVRYGYRRLHLHVLLRREGWPVNHKRVYRLYCEEGLMIRTKHRTKRVSLPRVTPAPATRPNERWSMDFLADTLVHGRSFKDTVGKFMAPLVKAKRHADSCRVTHLSGERDVPAT